MRKILGTTCIKLTNLFLNLHVASQMARSMHKGINEKTQYACTNLLLINFSHDD